MKTLDRFMLRQFLPLFVMTFLICTFIVLMQFLWMHLQDLVGKGVGMDVMAQLFFYAALSMVPMALPLGVLLASLMTFGNLGESMELTAMKAGGISLFRVMKPLIILMVFISVGAFFFQNNVLPIAQTKMWTLLKSVRQKTPELDIAEGEFNYQLPNINIYVESKNRDNGMLYSVMIYDFRQGFDRSRVILADSATLRTSPDKTHMLLDLHHGELFENLREGSGNSAAPNSLYRSEQFAEKLITVAFDANFSMRDEGEISNTYAGKNVAQLRHSIDSIQARVDSMGTIIGDRLVAQDFVNVRPEQITDEQRAPDARPELLIDLDSLSPSLTADSRREVILAAQAGINNMRWDFQSHALYLNDQQEQVRRHMIEFYRRFTLSLSCLIFFFIGAPLGAIIRKGGLGTPLVISVLLFIFYYIIDNFGYRQARDGKIPVFEGVWLSSIILLPLGIFVTYKAVKDSTVFNADSYMRLFRTLTGNNRRTLAVKEVIIEDYRPDEAVRLIDAVIYDLDNFTSVEKLNSLLEPAVSYISNSRKQTVIDKLNSLPIIEPWYANKLLRFKLKKVLAGLRAKLIELNDILNREIS